MKKIPITAITGFLGSGKTTLLNHILENNQGLKIGVVVNDYGQINIDSKLIAARTDKTLELTNGCMCCSLSSLELDEAISQFAHPGSQIDYIIIEASGLAEPSDLAATLRAAMGRYTRLDSIIAIIDAYNLEKNAAEHDSAIRQIEYSDFVIINKTDLVPKSKVDDITKLIKGMNERVRIFTAKHAQVDVRLLLGQEPERAEHKEPGHKHKHAHDDYSSVSFETDKALDPLKFQNFVNKQIPNEVYRAKGFVNLGNKGHRRKYLFQLVGKRADITWTDWGEEKPQTALVFIGKGFDKAKTLAQIEACIDPEPTKYDPGIEVVLPRREL
ncbi:MAG TPA: GTP-binding protein [Candidatus Dormibacteraeota bacterium]|nr:GTP-binding protein [Candidatus Dormibacteraeota bacterium]